jgi:hypothetical protein
MRVATAADAYGAATDAEEELKEAKSREPKWRIATLLGEAGPTASHGASFVHQEQSHPGEHSPIIDFAATTRFTAPAY